MNPFSYHQKGVHTGEPLLITKHQTTGRNIYHGTMLSLAKRISDTANGGQIIISGETWEEILGHLEKLNWPEVVDMGNYILTENNQVDQVHLFQILPSCLATKFEEEIAYGRTFGPLRFGQKMSASYFDSPSGNVHLVFTYIERKDSVSMPCMFSAVITMSNLFRSLLKMLDGYECHEG